MKHPKQRYSLRAYDKDHDIYDDLHVSSDSYNEVLKWSKIFAFPLVYGGRLRSSVNFEPYDWLEIYDNYTGGSRVIRPTGKIERVDLIK